MTNKQQQADSKTLRKVWILCAGSRGDVQPFVAVGAALVKSGYEVTCFTMEKYLPFVESFGIRGIALRPNEESSSEEEKQQQLSTASKRVKVDHHNHSWTKGNTLILFLGIIMMQKMSASHQAEVIQSEIAMNGLPDLCLSSPLTAGICLYLATKHNVPYLELMANTPIFDPNWMHFGLPTLPFGWHKVLQDGIFWFAHAFQMPLVKAFNNKDDKDLEKRFPSQKYVKYLRNPDRPHVVLFSKELATAMYPTASPMHHFVGTTIIESKDQCGDNAEHFGGVEAQKKLEDFLSERNGPKPIYLGWGSMISMDPSKLANYCVKAVHRAGQRAIVLGGEAKLTMDMIEDPELLEYAKNNVLFVDSAPHEWLFPRVAATVHHGGAGTTTTALRAGVPTIITPVLLDQYDHSEMVRKLQVGCGFKKQMQDITWNELGDAISQVVSDGAMYGRCKALSKKLHREDGAAGAMNEIESFWDEYCLTGKFHTLFADGLTPSSATTGGAPKNSMTGGKSLLLLMTAVAAAAAIGAAFSF